MTNKDKIKLANKLIKEVLIDNYKNEINYDEQFDEFNKSILWVITNYWYLHDMPIIFADENGYEIDEWYYNDEEIQKQIIEEIYESKE